jgi:dTDP-4-dehydrorhamnose reductase
MVRLKIIITGACGMLGTDLQSAFAGHELVLTDVLGDVTPMDITDTAQVMDVVGSNRPDVIIHAAAYTDVDGCERDPDTAYKVNGLGTRNVAAACCNLDAVMVYISTDFVFDGEKCEPYTEYDQTNPLGHYGASKLVGEQVVSELCPRHFITRTAWLYGEHGKNFPYTMLNAAKTRKELSVVSDQIGSPTFTVDLAAAIRDLVTGPPLFGTYHITNSGSCSWYDFAKEIFRLSGITDVEVTPILSEDWPSPTKRPKYSVLRHRALELQGRDNLRPWQEALKDFISRINR